MRITEQSTVADLSKALLESDVSLHVALQDWLLKNEIDYQLSLSGIDTNDTGIEPYEDRI